MTWRGACPYCGHGHDRWLLDLFCGAGGAGMGYHRAGFGVVGVDNRPQPHYPFTFVRTDALSLLRRLIDGGWFAVDTMPEGTTIQASLSHFAAIHASPPCQFITQMSARWRGKGTKADEHPNLLTPTLDLLRPVTSVSWIVENVPGARRLMNPTVTLHGGMFGLGVNRPRLFETNMFLLGSQSPRTKHPVGVYGKPDGRTTWRYRNNGNYKGKGLIRAWKSLEEGSEAMGIDWMDVDELREAIPPAYTEYIGSQLLALAPA